MSTDQTDHEECAIDSPAPQPVGPFLPAASLARLLGAVTSVGSELDLPTVLRQVVESAVELVHAESCVLGIVDEDGDGQVLSQLITVGREQDVPQRAREGELLRLGELQAGVPGAGPVLGVPVHVGATVFGHLRLASGSDRQDFTDDEEEVVRALAVAAGVAIGNARLYQQARRGSAWREAGRSISTALLSAAPREDVITLLVETAGAVLSADGMLIVLTDPSGSHVAASSGAPGPALDAELLDGLRPVRRDGQPATAVSEDLQGFAVPLGPAGQSCGGVMVALWSAPPSPLLVEDLTAFAAQAAVVLELADRRLEAEQGAVLADRDRIGRDLHDLVIQRLFATGMRLQSALRLIVDDPAAARSRVDMAVDELDGTIRELRATIYGLEGALDAHASLRASLLEVVDAATEHLGFAPAVRLDGLLDTVVPAATAQHVLATVREALSNAARHAHASRVEVTVALHDRQLRVVVDDDGVGTPSSSGARSGLRNLEQRAHELGGELVMGAGQLGGTRLTWQVPLPDEVPAHRLQTGATPD